MAEGQGVSMSKHLKKAAAVLLSAAVALGAAGSTGAQQAPMKITLFGQPSVNNDAIWMAFEKGFFKEEGLDVTYRLFPSGTTAFQTFQTGQGDIVLSGDLPSVQYFERVKGDYRTIAVMERDTKGYVVVARKEISKPQDLVGKTVATRVGSTGSWFISEYLQKNGIDPTEGHGQEPRHADPAHGALRRRDRGVLHMAACWIERARDLPRQAHYLSDATGYIQGYLVAGARPGWLASPEGKEPQRAS